MAEKISHRSAGLDIIRIFALFCVNGIHFFTFSGFLGYDINNVSMYALTVMRTFFTICVPMFIVLTGYLSCKKTLSKKYYRGIVKVLAIYILACIAIYPYRVLYLKENISVLSLGTGILNFTAAPYAWYVEMYIGLFMLIPFLNLIYNNLHSRAHKLALIGTMVFLTALPGALNVWCLHSPAFWAMPSSIDSYTQLIPQWWVGMYPVTYYFIGCCLREYGIKISKKTNFALIAAAVILFGGMNIYRSYPVHFVGGAWQDWGCLSNVVIATLVFNLLLKIDDSKISAKLNKPLAVVSDLTFGGYLMSFISDNFLYTRIDAAAQSGDMLIKYFPLAPIASFIFCLAASLVLNIIYNLICKAAAAVSAKK